MNRAQLKAFFEKAIYDKKDSYRIRTLLSALLMAVIATFMFIFNLISGDRQLSVITGIMSFIGISTFIFINKTNKYKIFRWFIAITFVIALLGFLYLGSGEGIAPFWAFLLPFMSYFMLGTTVGAWLGASMILISMLLLWTPLEAMLLFEYSNGFIRRYPILYASCYFTASVTEYMRVITKNRLEETVRDLEAITRIDSLTGIENRRSFEQRVAETWDLFAGKENHLSILLIDIDYFKRYNDVYGHLKGDEALKEVAAILTGIVTGDRGYVSRWGGEEFICLLPFHDSIQSIVLVKEIVQAFNDAKIEHRGSKLPEKILTVSVGTSTVNATAGIDPKEVVIGADESLYEAKNYGRNRLGRNRAYG